MSEERQTVAGAFAKIESHEELCAERYRNIHGAINDIKALLKWAAGSLACAAAAVLWHLLTTDVAGNAARITALEQRHAPVTVVQSQGQR